MAKNRYKPKKGIDCRGSANGMYGKGDDGKRGYYKMQPAFFAKVPRAKQHGEKADNRAGVNYPRAMQKEIQELHQEYGDDTGERADKTGGNGSEEVKQCKARFGAQKLCERDLERKKAKDSKKCDENKVLFGEEFFHKIMSSRFP